LPMPLVKRLLMLLSWFRQVVLSLLMEELVEG